MRLVPALSIFFLFSSSIEGGNDNRHEASRRIFQGNAAIEADLLHGQNPTRGVKKMSNDEGEKFFLDYWGLHEDPDAEWLMGNNSTHNSFQPPVSASRGSFDKNRRDFQCPADSNNCISINRPSSCCRTGETCVLVEDTGSGDVGCCPQGQQCSGNIGACQSGYTACSASLGGGCCFPGYECVSGGCAYVSIVTVTVHSTAMMSTATYTAPTEPPSSPSTPSRTSTDSTGDFAPPARPTSLTTATTSRGSSSETRSICPVGFYACSAVYQGGCCRTGRQCDTTSCPETSSTTVESNADRTIVAPADATSTTSQCAGGWFSCAADMGGGCCPTGFVCGSVSCTATATESGASATGTVAKNAASRRALGESNRMLGTHGLTMILYVVAALF